MDSFKRTEATRTLRKRLIYMNKISGSFVVHPSALRYTFMWVAQTQTDRYLLLPFVFVHCWNMNQWTEKTHDREKKSPSHKVAEIQTGTNSCFFTSANTKCLTMQSKWLIWWMRNRKSWERPEKHHLAVPVCLGAATRLQGQILPSD